MELSRIPIPLDDSHDGAEVRLAFEQGLSCARKTRQTVNSLIILACILVGMPLVSFIVGLFFPRDVNVVELVAYGLLVLFSVFFVVRSWRSVKQYQSRSAGYFEEAYYGSWKAAELIIPDLDVNTIEGVPRSPALFRIHDKSGRGFVFRYADEERQLEALPYPIAESS